MARDGKRVAVFQPEFKEDLRYWIKSDRNTGVSKGLGFCSAFEGIPHDRFNQFQNSDAALSGCWSRRITQKHRLVYRVIGERIDLLQARHHY